MECKNIEDFAKLVNTCRKLGVKSFKNPDFSIELDHEALFPESSYKRNKLKKEAPSEDESAEQRILNHEAALFWSAAPLAEASGS